jgi:hypothetical protein
MKAKVSELKISSAHAQGACSEIVEKCEGCARIIEMEDKKYCAVYPQPASKWRKGICNFATHVKKELPKDDSGKKVNPLKAAKRAARGH